MNNKKVTELIKKGMLYQNKSSHVSSYKEKAKNCFEEALSELQKSDWISVEDELPKYGEEVLVCNKKDPSSISLTYRVNHRGMDIDRHGFHWESCLKPITHWHKIDKLDKIK